MDGDDLPYTEVHHIEPLSEGGEDVLENVACLCPAHHREVHIGRRASELVAALRALRLS
jgi:predicted HNH restriction endonuclease